METLYPLLKHLRGDLDLPHIRRVATVLPTFVLLQSFPGEMEDEGGDVFAAYDKSYRSDLKPTFQVHLPESNHVDRLPVAQGSSLFNVPVSPLYSWRLYTNGQVNCSVSPTHGNGGNSFAIHRIDESFQRFYLERRARTLIYTNPGVVDESLRTFCSLILNSPPGFRIALWFIIF